MISVTGCNHTTPVTSANIGQIGRTSPHIGDKAAYSIKNTLPKIGNTTVESGGSRTYTVAASGNHGRSLPPYITRTFDLQEDIRQHVEFLRTSRTVIIWLGEDASANLYLLGESLDGKSWDIVTDADPPLYMPSQMKVGSWWRYTANFNSGNTETAAYQCVGTESISTPAGPFDAYKLGVEFSRTPFQSKVTGYDWLPRNLPIVFELKEIYSNAGPSLNMGTNYSLESVELAD